MSSPLPQDVLDAFMAKHRDRNGWFRCSGYKRRPHGPFVRREIHIDHIRTEHEWPELMHDLDNLQPLCIPCHKAKTADEARLRAKGRLRPRGARLPTRTPTWRWLLYSAIYWTPFVLVALFTSAVGWDAQGQQLLGWGWSFYVVIVLALLVHPACRWLNTFDGEDAKSKPNTSSRERERALAAAEAVMGKPVTIDIIEEN